MQAVLMTRHERAESIFVTTVKGFDQLLIAGIWHGFQLKTHPIVRPALEKFTWRFLNES